MHLPCTKVLRVLWIDWLASGLTRANYGYLHLSLLFWIFLDLFGSFNVTLVISCLQWESNGRPIIARERDRRRAARRGGRNHRDDRDCGDRRDCRDCRDRSRRRGHGLWGDLAPHVAECVDRNWSRLGEDMVRLRKYIETYCNEKVTLDQR